MVQFLWIIFAVLLQMQDDIFIVRSYLGRCIMYNTRYSAKSRVRLVTGKFSLVMAINMCFQKGDCAILDFVGSKIWCHRKSRPNSTYLLTKFGENVSKRGRVMEMYQFSKWRPAAILDFAGREIWCHWMLRLAVSIPIPNLAKISQRTAKLWRFTCFQMADRRHLGFCQKWNLMSPEAAAGPIVPNLVKISQKADELWWFKCFRNGSCCHLEFTSGVDFCDITLFGSWLCMLLQNLINAPWLAAELLSFVKNSKWRNYYSATLDHPRSLLVDLNPVFKCPFDGAHSFGKYAHPNIWQIWPKTRIHAPKISFFGVLTPKHYFVLYRDPQKALTCAKTCTLIYWS